MSPRKSATRRVLSQLVLMAGLVVLWGLLWGQFSPLTILTGLLLALFVSGAFYLPAVQLSGRINLWRSLVFFAVAVVDIVRASWGIAWMAFNPRFRPSNAIIGVPLVTQSDLILSWTATAISIVPGSIVVDLDRDHSILYVHVIGVENDADLEAFIADVHATERRLILAIGSAEEAAAVRRLPKGAL